VWHGVDVSDDQAEISWADAAWHIDQVMVEVGFGTKNDAVPNKTGAPNYRVLTGLGKRRGAYFFGYPTTGQPAEWQGERAADIAMNAGWRPASDLPFALDIEVNPEQMSPSALSDWVEAWLAGTGIDPKRLAVCTDPGFWAANTDGRQVNAHLWVMAWGLSSAPRLRGLPAPFMWQTTDRGRVPGIGPFVDLDTLLFVPDPAKGPHEQVNVQDTPAGAIVRPEGEA